MSRAAAYRRLAITILGLDVATLAADIFDARNEGTSPRADRTRDTRRRVEGRRTALRDRSTSLDRAPGLSHKMIACAVLPCTAGGGLDASAANGRSGMRTRVIGAMPIGSRVVTEPDARGHEAVQESRIWDASAVGDGASDVEAASVVFDLTDSLSFCETPGAVEFFEISTAYFGDVEHSFRLISSSRSTETSLQAGTRQQKSHRANAAQP